MDDDLSVRIATLISQLATTRVKIVTLALRVPEHREFLISLSEKLETGQGFLSALQLEDPAVNIYCLGRCIGLVRVYTEQLTQELDVACAAKRFKKRYFGEIQRS